jgi:acyl-CoA synthetase (AMP-forming)/AMP-acid ligase II
MYGATEAAARLTYLPPADLRRKLGSIGRAIPGVEIRIVTHTGEIAGTGEIGELVASGANIACGYWNDPEETAQRFTPEGYRTGDLGYKDEEGYLYLVGRRQDVIKVGAHRVGAIEIENVLHGHPAVADVAVVPVSHPLLGEAPVACVVLREALTDAERTLRAFCAERLASYKVPTRVVELPELPRLPGTGKRDRAMLVEWLQTLACGAASRAPHGADGLLSSGRPWPPAFARRTSSRSSGNRGSRGPTPDPQR